MYINPNSEKPIFIQIAEQLEDSIFTGIFSEETKIPSTNEISALLNINPHTVLKGMNMLVDEEIIYKKRIYSPTVVFGELYYRLFSSSLLNFSLCSFFCTILIKEELMIPVGMATIATPTRQIIQPNNFPKKVMG